MSLGSEFLKLGTADIKAAVANVLSDLNFGCESIYIVTDHSI